MPDIEEEIFLTAVNYVIKELEKQTAEKPLIEATKNNKLRFIGENKQITRGRKAFTITGKLNENKSFITERFNYNYMTKNEKGNSTRLYGTLKK